MNTAVNAEVELHKAMGDYYHDPLGWVMFAFPWDTDPDLQIVELQEPWTSRFNSKYGPDTWFCELCDDWQKHMKENPFNGKTAVPPYKDATTSGHGIGKSAGSAFIILYIASTRPYSKGVVTSNTSDQLRTKTWGELAKWKNKCITGHWFTLNNGKGNMNLFHNKFKETWRVDAITCREENSESFAGLHCANSSPWYLFDEACHDDQTEVMTNSGWKLFSDLTTNDKLLTINPDSESTHFDVIEHLHVADYDGEMLLAENKGSNLCVTPNHRMMFETRKQPGLMRFQQADDIKWSNKRFFKTVSNLDTGSIGFHVIPKYENSQHCYESYSIIDSVWCELLGWWITDGSYQLQNGKPSTVTFYQKKEAGRKRIEHLLNMCRFDFYESEQGFHLSNAQLCNEFHACGLGFDRRVPDYLFTQTPENIEHFINGVVGGDGYRKGDVDIIYTSNENLAGDYQALILLSGLTSVVNKRKLAGKQSVIEGRVVITKHDGFTVSRSKSNTAIQFKPASEPKRVSYKGKVYCATVSGGVLFTRRGGVPLWSGNSAVPDKIWEVAEGGTTDGEPFWFVFGNPTRNSGRFRECWRRFRNSWNKRKVDSRNVQVTNKKLLSKWAEEYGENSDFYKVRVKGEFPSASSNQKIPGDLLESAMKRESPHLPGDPKVMSLDVARGGSDNCVINFRQGLNGKIRPPIILPGSEYRDSMKLAAKMVECIEDFQPDMSFVDATGVGGPVADRIRQLGYDCIDINFASKSPDSHFANMRAYMADKWLQWLKDGGSVNYSEDLQTETGAVEFTHNGKDQEILIPKDMIKKKIGVSTDEFDAYILLHAMPVAPKHRYSGGGNKPATTAGYNPWRDTESVADMDYDPFD